MVVANCCPFWSSAILRVADVVPAKNSSQLALICAAADREVLGDGVDFAVVELLPQAATTSATTITNAAMPTLFVAMRLLELISHHPFYL
jgi:hypothetical protein